MPAYATKTNVLNIDMKLLTPEIAMGTLDQVLAHIDEDIDRSVERLFALRASSLRHGGLFAPVSREGALILNNLFLATAVGAVLVGTLYPLVLDALTGTTINLADTTLRLQVTAKRDGDFNHQPPPLSSFLVEHRASVEGPGSPTPPDLLRLSIGIEEPADLIADLTQALAPSR